MMSEFRRRLLMQNALIQQGSGLYTPLAFIKADGRQWFDTLYKPNPLTDISIKLRFEKNKYTWNESGGNSFLKAKQPIFSVNNGGGSNQFNAFFFWNNANPNDIKQVTVPEQELFRRIGLFQFKPASGVVFNHSIGFRTRTDTNADTLRCLHDYTDHIYNRMNVCIYRFTIQEGNKVIKDFIPCKMEDGRIGLYETVEGQFYGSATDVPFIAGEYIKFKDPEVAKICVQNFSSDGVGVTYDDAQEVTNISSLFLKTPIKFFNEFKFFTGVKEIKDYQGFTGNSTLEEISLPISLLKVGINAFNDTISLKTCKGLEHLEIIRNTAFGGYKKKIFGTNEDLFLPNLKEIGLNAFFNTHFIAIKDLGNISIIPDGNYEGSFGNMFELALVILPKSITKIGKYAFANDTKLEDVVCNATTPPTLESTSFNKCPIANIYVPDQSLEAYRTAPEWSTYADKIKPLSTYVPE